MAEIKYHICDICGKKIEYYNEVSPDHVSLYVGDTNPRNDLKISYDVCPSCGRKIYDAIALFKSKGSLMDITVKVPIKNDTKVDPEYVGFDSHGCCTWYRCPTCGHSWNSWDSDEIIKSGACPECGQKLNVERLK